MKPFVVQKGAIPVEFLEIVELLGMMLSVLPDDFGTGRGPVSCHVLAKIVAELGHVDDCLFTGLYGGFSEHSWLEFRFEKDYYVVLDVYGVCRYPPVSVVLLQNYGESRRQYTVNGTTIVSASSPRIVNEGTQYFTTSISKVDVHPQLSEDVVRDGVRFLKGTVPMKITRLWVLFAELRTRFYKPPE